MNQTNGDSKRVEVVVNIFGHEPEKTKDGYKILTGEDKPGREEIGIEPGMTISVKEGIDIDPKSKKGKQILENQEKRKTEKQAKKQKQR